MTLTANASGTITGKFALSGSASVKTATFTGSGGTVVNGLIFADGFNGEVTNKKQLTVESIISAFPSNDDVVPLFQVITPPLSGEASGVSLFIENKGTTFISVQLREVIEGLPSKVIATSILQSSAITDGTWTNFLFSCPVPLSLSNDYAICVNCSDATGEVAVLDLTQQATSHSPYIKGFGASFDGIDYQLYKNKKLSFKLLMASYTSSSRNISLGDVTVNDISRLLVFSPSSRNIGGLASSRLLLTLPDLSVVEALDGQVIKLPASVTGNISVSRQLYANSRFSHKAIGGSQLVIGDIVDVASYISDRIKAESGCRLRLDVIGTVPSGAGLLTYVSDADTVGWVEMTLVGSPVAQGGGVFKYTYLSDVIASNNDVVFRVRLNGVADAVPVVYSVAAETILTYVNALKNGDNAQAFKVAPAVAADDAIQKDQLDTAINSASGSIAALAGLIAQEVLDRGDGDDGLQIQINDINSNRFKVFGLTYTQIADGGTITIPPKETFRIAVIGGGGGAAGYETGHGGDGTDSYLETSGAELCRAFGGLGGLQGYGTGSTPSPKNEPDRERSGVSFNPLWSSIIIATSKNDSELVALAGNNGFGNGGGVDRTGTDGVPNTKGAGNAGAAGCLEFIIKNTSNINDLVIDVVVGVGGTKTSAGGANGVNGSVAVLSSQ